MISPAVQLSSRKIKINWSRSSILYEESTLLFNTWNVMQQARWREKTEKTTQAKQGSFTYETEVPCKTTYKSTWSSYTNTERSKLRKNKQKPKKNVNTTPRFLILNVSGVVYYRCLLTSFYNIPLRLALPVFCLVLVFCLRLCCMLV